MTTIDQIKTMPDKTGLDQIQVRITKVFPREAKTKTGKPFSSQRFKIEDATGTIYAKIWRSPDISQYLDKDVAILSNSAGSGVSVNVWNGAASVEITQDAKLQVLTQNSPAPAQGQAVADEKRPTASGGSVSGVVIPGEAVGAAINKAVDILIAKDDLGSNLEELENKIWAVASRIYGVSAKMKSGELFGAGGSEAKTGAGTIREVAYNRLANQDGGDEDVPF